MLQAVERVAAREGHQGMSLRKVAAEAGIAPNAVYTYVQSWEDLLHEVADRFLGEVDLSPLGTHDCPRCGALVFVDGVRRHFAARPALAHVMAGQRTVGPHSLALNETLLGFFAQHMLGREYLAVDVLTTWLFGEVLLAPGDQTTAVVASRLARVNAQDYPRTAVTPPADEQAPAEVILDGLRLDHRCGLRRPHPGDRQEA